MEDDTVLHFVANYVDTSFLWFRIGNVKECAYV